MGNVVLMSKNHKDIDGIRIVSSFTDLDLSNVDVLLFHNSDNDTSESLSELLSLKSRKDIKVIYVNSELDSTLVFAIQNIGGDVYTYNELLDDADSIQMMIDTYNSATNDLVLRVTDSSIEKLHSLFDKIASANTVEVGKMLKNKEFVTSLKTSVQGVKSELETTKEANSGLLEAFTTLKTMLDYLNSLNADFKENLDKAQKDLDDVTLELNARNKVDISTSSNTLYSFPSCRVALDKKVIYVKVYGPCRYLVSFFLAYQRYLTVEKRKSSKILLVVPKLRLLLDRYSDFDIMIQDTLGVLDMNKNVYVTYEPKKSVVDRFLSQQEVSYHIVIDMLYSDIDLLDGSTVKKLMALSSTSDIDRFADIQNELKTPSGKSRLILSSVNSKSSEPIVLKGIREYLKATPDVRASLWSKEAGSEFNKINAFLDVK